jgi:hypothetical protein
MMLIGVEILLEEERQESSIRVSRAKCRKMILRRCLTALGFRLCGAGLTLIPQRQLSKENAWGVEPYTLNT